LVLRMGRAPLCRLGAFGLAASLSTGDQPAMRLLCLTTISHRGALLSRGGVPPEMTAALLFTEQQELGPLRPLSCANGEMVMPLTGEARPIRPAQGLPAEGTAWSPCLVPHIWGRRDICGERIVLALPGQVRDGEGVAVPVFAHDINRPSARSPAPDTPCKSATRPGASAP
jgi:hypothetical protein